MVTDMGMDTEMNMEMDMGMDMTTWKRARIWTSN
jgi:hypothetical protein